MKHRSIIVFHTLLDRGHSKKRCPYPQFYFGRFHSQHYQHIYLTLKSLSVLNNLFQIASQPMKAYLGIAPWNHISFHHLNSRFFFLIQLQVLKQEYKLDFERIQYQSSSTSSINGSLLCIVTRSSYLAEGQCQPRSCKTLETITFREPAKTCAKQLYRLYI